MRACCGYRLAGTPVRVPGRRFARAIARSADSPYPWAREHRHLAEAGIVIHARVRVRVTGKNEASPEYDADAVGHGVGPPAWRVTAVRAAYCIQVTDT